jgi:hypothetical protein
MSNKESQAMSKFVLQFLSKQEKLKCERCGKILDPRKAVWLELSNTDGRYYLEIPKGHISQGGFCFGKDCAKIEMADITMKK